MLLRFKVSKWGPFRQGFDLDLEPENSSEGGFQISHCYQRANKIIAIFGLNSAGKSQFVNAFKSVYDLTRGNLEIRDLQKYIPAGDKNGEIQFNIRISAFGTTYDYELIIDPYKDRTIKESIYMSNGQSRIYTMHYIGELVYCVNDVTSENTLEFSQVPLTGSTFLNMLYNDGANIKYGYDNTDFCIALLSFFEIHTSEQNTFKINKEDDNLGVLRHFLPDVEQIIWNDVANKYSASEKNKHKEELKTIGNLSEYKTILPLTNYTYCINQDDSVQYYHPYLKYKNLAEPVDILEESEGTKKLLELSGILSRTDECMTWIIDELDRKLHPVTVKEIIRKFIEDKMEHQFIFTTHETSLIDYELLGTEDIYVIERDRKGSAKLRKMCECGKKTFVLEEELYLDGSYDSYRRD